MADSQAPSTPQVRTLLLTDLVDSTGLVERIGDNAAATLFRAHDRIVLDLQQRWRGRLIDRSDGLLLIFERPIDGLGFALDYVRGLRELGREHNQPLQARAGLHVGEVLLWENSVDAVQLGAKSLEVEGLAKPLADTELFPPAAAQMIRVGESTGSLDKQLVGAANFHERELEYKLKRFTDLFEPAVIIGVGLIVGFIAVALVSAMYGVFDQVKA